MKGRKVGYIHTVEQKRKISESLKGKRVSIKTEFKKGHKNKHSMKGENNSNWKGGISNIKFRLRQTKEYRLWRKAVLERDNYTCIWCGRTNNIQTDHIKPFALFPELRFAIDNGRTLCVSCHKTTDTYAGKLNKLNLREVKYDNRSTR